VQQNIQSAGIDAACLKTGDDAARDNSPFRRPGLMGADKSTNAASTPEVSRI
jgi:hypothetical protein